MLNPDRYFDPTPAVRDLARALYARVASLPLVCPHGHVDPRMLAEDTPFPDPAQLLVIPDHYVDADALLAGRAAGSAGRTRAATARRSKAIRAQIWQLFADTFTCSAARRAAAGCDTSWTTSSAIDERLDGRRRQRIYDRIEALLRTPEFRPRALFERFNIEVLCTTDAATDSLIWHQRDSRLGLGRRR